jgi:membrane-associated phospholipid phosphatase
MRNYLEKAKRTTPVYIRDCRSIKQFALWFFVNLYDMFPLMIFFSVYIVWFTVLEHINRLHYTVIHTWIDDRIPFIEEFIVPYELWFAFVIVSVVFLYFKDRGTYYRTASFLCIGMSLFLIISSIWPNIQFLRPGEFPRDNVFTHMIAALYQSDTPTNLCPSIHVYNSIAVVAGILNSSWRIFCKKGVRIASVTLGVLIILSTLFIKQHSFFDVCCACALAVFSYFLCFHLGFTFSGKMIRRGAFVRFGAEQSE